jgi:hypothetical protein
MLYQKTKKHFAGDSPPEIFVGRHNYPDISAGILSSDGLDDTEDFSMPEEWYKKKLSINHILSNRNELIYGRFRIPVRKQNSMFLKVMQEVSMAYKSVSTEFFLKKIPRGNLAFNKYSPIIANPAPLERVRLQENPRVKPQVDYLVSDTDSKASDSIKELYNADIPISNINKILSSGLLGLKTKRRLVPTKWAITAIDDTISKQLLRKIKYYPEINEVLLFNAEYNGNHYEIILLPDKFSFEVLEAEMRGSLWNKTGEILVWQDYEFFNGRKSYAGDVTGAYYANRLALCEYLKRIKRQATAIFLREVRPEYYAPLGVGILREVTRDAFRKEPERFDNIGNALKRVEERIRLPVLVFTDKSVILRKHGKQRKLNQWF